MKTTMMMMMMKKSVVSVIHGDPTEMTCGQGDTRVQPGGHDDSPTSVLHFTALPHAPRSIKPNAPLKGYRCTEANCTSDGCTASQLNQCKMKSKSRKPTAASL